MSEKEWTIGNIIALAERFGICIHRNIQAAYYHGEIDVREREKEEANKNEIEARTELEQAVSNILKERDALRAENERLKTALEEISLADTDAYTDNHYHELKRVVNIAQQALKEVTP
jgi:di/tripeptidase